MIENDNILASNINKYSIFWNLNLKNKKNKIINIKNIELLVSFKGKKKFTIKAMKDALNTPTIDVSIKLTFLYFKILDTVNFPKII